MNARCPVLPADPDGLDRAEARALREHLVACPDCRRAWFREDASRMFAVLGDDPIPAAVLEAVSVGVSAEIDRLAVATRVRGFRPAWTTAAALVLAVAFGTAVVRDPGPAGRTVALAEPETGLAERAAFRLNSAGEGVQMVDLTVGDRQLVMIFDGRLQL